MSEQECLATSGPIQQITLRILLSVSRLASNPGPWTHTHTHTHTHTLAEDIAQTRAEERERCAKIADEVERVLLLAGSYPGSTAALIRALK